jgi:transglutaminase-like putative cysteine protease
MGGTGVKVRDRSMANRTPRSRQEQPLLRDANTRWLVRGLRSLGLLVAVWVAASGSATAEVAYWNPRPYNVTYIFELEPDPNKIDRATDLKLWLPLPREWDSQKSVQILSIDPPPDGTYEDPEFGNRMAFWDFGKGPEKAVYTASIKFRLEACDIRVDVDPNKVGTYDKSSPEYKLYTRNEHTICLTPKIQELAREAIGDEKNPYLQARRIAKYVYKKVHFKVVEFDRGRGIQPLLDYPLKDDETGEEYYEGACNQRSALVVALCRAVGIPARCVFGLSGWTPWRELRPLHSFEKKLTPGGLAGAQSFGQLGTHTWTEFYMPNYGWIPEDYQPMGFNSRAILTKGRDIKIGPHCPEGENQGYGSRWVPLNDGRADGIYFAVWNIAKIQTSRVKSLVEPDPFPADALVTYRARLDEESHSKGVAEGWRKYVLEEMDYRTRGLADPSLGLADSFERTGLLYERDAFVCHMLRNIIGADKFSRIIEQYEQIRVSSGKAVPSAQFQQLAETAYGQSLRWFFDAWAARTQLPQFKLDQVSIARENDGWCVSGHLLQTGKRFYRLPIELALYTNQGLEKRSFWQEEPDARFELRTSHQPSRLVVDPDHEILKIQRMPPLPYWLWDVDSKNIVVIYGTGGETEANKAAAESLQEDGHYYSSNPIKADTEATAEDLNADCLILLGRPAVNQIAERLRDRFPIKFEGAKFTWQGKVYDQATQGVIAAVDEGRSSKKLIILCAGMSGEATENIGAIDEVYTFFDLTRYDRMPSYLIFDRNKWVVAGEWELTDPKLMSSF